MGHYSIRDLETLSGIKAHTIRIWEKRYDLVRPRRTQTNIRYYSDDDLKKLMNVSLLNNHGIKISKIAHLSLPELNKRVTEISAAGKDKDAPIDQLIIAMIDLDEQQFEKVMTEFILRYGFEETVVKIIYPFLEKIGVLWLTHNISPAQEHFISILIRQKMIVAIDALPLAPRNNTRVLLFLPEGELHELGLLFYYYLAKKAGFVTFYLGQMVPYKDLISICKTHNPRVLITSVTSAMPSDSLQSYFTRLCREMKDCTILAAGLAVRNAHLRKPTNLRILSNAAELTAQLKGL